MEVLILFILGWTASALVIMSLLMKSMMYARWISIIGGIIYAGYGLLFGSIPLFAYNVLGSIINIHSLRKLFIKNNLFDVLHVLNNDAFLLHFLQACLKEIQKSKPDFTGIVSESSYCIMALRNAKLVGIVIVRNGAENEMIVDLDYVIPQYRDSKSTQFIMEKYAGTISSLASNGLKYFSITGGSSGYNKYLLRTGYQLYDGDNLYRMSVETIKERYLGNVH